MKNKSLLITSFVLLTLTSCNKKVVEDTSKKESESSISISDSSLQISETSSKTSESSINESSSVDSRVIENDDYYWHFEENQAIKGSYDFSVSTNVEGESLSLAIDDNKIEKLAKNNLNATLYYETKDCNSDSASGAADYLYLNNNKVSKLPSDGSKGIEFNITDLEWGINVITVTIGGLWGQSELDYKSPLTGNGDDYFIGNMYLETSTKLKLKPYKMVFYKAKKNSSTFAKYDVEYEDGKMYYISDGWSGQIAYDGSTFKNSAGLSYDCPQKIDFYFDYEIPEAISSYSLDTTTYSDGVHKFSLYNVDNEVVLQNNIVIDNASPIITPSIKEYAHINNKNKIKVDFSDTDTIASSYVKIDGIEYNDEFDMTTLTSGNHNLSMYAVDRAGNETYEYREFYLEDNYNDIVIPESLANLEYTKESNTSGNNVYDEFKISNVDKTKDVYFTYQGSSHENEEIILSAYNVNTSSYDTITTIMSGEEVNVKFAALDYTNSQNEVLVKASTNYVGNGSNMIMWSSDTQYLSKDTYGSSVFHDINPFYNQLMNYVSNQYKSGNISYFVHTGDVVDDNPQDYDDATLRYEWNMASAAFDILDENKVPYGVCGGNHDVGTNVASIDYSYFSEFFGVDRYSTSQVFTGSLNDNTCHYDLITIGNYDFIILYIGFGIEAKDETVNWANKVLKQYSHRNAIIATHGYLDETGKRDEAIQAEDIYNRIALPNDNVKFVFGGHTDGSFVIKQQVGDRVFYEVLNCYQFVEQQKYSNSHKINGYNCNGEGFIKTVVFDNDSVSFKTYSPITGVTKDPYSNTADGTYSIELVEKDHKLETSSFKAVQ